jgi:hypothetical protein
MRIIHRYIIRAILTQKRRLALILVTVTLFVNSSNALAQKVNKQQYYLIETNGLTQIIINQDTITSNKSLADNRGYFLATQSLIVKVVKRITMRL